MKYFCNTENLTIILRALVGKHESQFKTAIREQIYIVKTTNTRISTNTFAPE